MSFSKLTPHLSARLDDLGLSEAMPLQSKLVPMIKSGADIVCQAPSQSGKTTTLMISVIQRLKSQADGTSPRVMIFVKDRDAAMRLERAFEPLLFRCDLRLLTAIDQHDLLGQRDTLFDGVDILIGTPTRLSKLFFTNALNTARIQMLWVTDADEYIPKTGSTEIVRISQSIDRCQKLLMYTKSHPKIKQLRQDLMPRAQLVQIDPSTD